MVKGKTKRRTYERPGSFLFKIEEIDPAYSFGSVATKYDHAPYSEHAHTVILTRCLVPDKFAGQDTEFTLIGYRSIACQLNGSKSTDRISDSVGTLTMRGDRRSYLGSMAFDTLLAIAPVILSGGLQYIYLSGSALRYGTSRITYIAFRREADPNDY